SAQYGDFLGYPWGARENHFHDSGGGQKTVLASRHSMFLQCWSCFLAPRSARLRCSEAILIQVDGTGNAEHRQISVDFGCEQTDGALYARAATCSSGVSERPTDEYEAGTECQTLDDIRAA